jgi:hypothetical protein
MPAAFPVVSDPTARDEGNAAHWAAQEWFNGRDPASLVNTKAYNGVIITAEMIEHVGEYLSALYIGEIEAETSFGGDAYRVNGRCDHRSYDRTSDTLYIDDFKYGWSIVDPEENWTLIAHAIGTCIFKNMVPGSISFRIHQPRPHHPDGKLREWRITYEQLMNYHRRIVNTLTHLSDELRTGLSWCGKCRALAHCPAASAAGMNAIDATTRTFTDQLTDAALSHELDVLRTASGVVSARLTALEEMAQHRLKNGAVIDNYAVETQYAHTRFKSGYNGPMLTALTGIDCVKKGTITPAEFKRRGGSQAVFDAITERPMTGVKLVRASADKRAKRLLGGK